MITLNVPVDAVAVSYFCRNVRMTYYVYTRHSRWYWIAGGSDGSAETRERAEFEARRWLRDGQ